MRRLQANLTYMFALAERNKGKPVPPSPAYLSSPPLNLQLKLRLPPPTAGEEPPLERPADPIADRVERDAVLKGLYKRLQSLYPGVDPRKEPAPSRAVGTGAGVGTGNLKGPNGQAAGSVGSNHSSPAPNQGQGQGTPLMGNASAPGLQMQMQQGLGQGQQVGGL